MNSIRFLPRLSLVLLPLTFIAPNVDAARTPPLCYRPSPNQTNTYRVEIELRGEGGTETTAGNITVTTRAIGSNVIALAFRGSLTPRRDVPTSPAYGLSGYPRWFAPASFSTGSEIQFDESGRVLRIAGDYPLPLPLGTFAQLFVELLPASEKSRWEITETLSALDDSISFGPAASFFGAQSTGAPYYAGPNYPRGSAAVIAVNRKTKYQVASSTPDRLTIKKSFALDSLLQAGNEPRLSASGEGEFVFDRRQGLIRSVELQTKAVMNTESVTRRMTAVLHLKLLEGKERDAALHPSTSQPVTAKQIFSPESALELERPSPTPRPQKKLSSDEVSKLMDDLKSEDTSARVNAASKFQTFELAATAPPELLTLMAGMLTNADSSMRMAAAKVIADQGTSEHVPLLIKLLKSNDHSARYSALRGLGRLKDKQAAEPLVAMIAAGGSDGYQAVEALNKIGADAEDAALTLLKERHNETKRQGCRILGTIGTKKSLDPLRELMLEPDYSLSSAASEAVKAIMARQ